MLTATKSSNNIILKTSIVGNYQLDRKFNTGAWESWNGTDWGGVPLLIGTQNFTDYDLTDGVYQYRTTFNTVVEYSTCIPIGSDHVGWTFENYTVPDGLFGEVLTSDDMAFSYLWGVDLLASNGLAWQDSQTRTMVKWAVFQLEKALNIDIFPREYFCDDVENEAVEESKFVIKEFPYPNRRNKRYTIISRHRPIQEVTRLDFFSPTDEKILDLIPWLRIDRIKGKFRIYPKQGKIQSFTSNSFPWVRILDMYNYPDAFHINYKTGYRDAELLPEDLRDIIGKIAALKMLNVIGDGILAGFSSSSLSLDGLSESFSSTQSATSGYFGSRILTYAKDIEAYIAENSNKYGNFRIGSI